MSSVLASVRSLAEADIVAACGVPWIDLKEPASGALGAVPGGVIAEVVAAYGASHTVSATIGDCWDEPATIPVRVAEVARTGAHYAKVGLYARDLSDALREALRAATRQGCGVIAVCFAESPPRMADVQLLAALGLAGVMLDTARKAGPGLTELMTLPGVGAFVGAVAEHGLLCGLAGRLTLADVPRLRPLGADYLGFRSALCASENRVAAVSEHAVRALCAQFPSPLRRLDRAARDNTPV